MIKKEDYKDCLDHIERHWKELTCSIPKDKDIHMRLPHRFISPDNNGFKHDQFYWDSYFIILGLVETGKVALAKGMVNNFMYLYNRFGIIPSRNRVYELGISQPPFLTSMALEIFNKKQDKVWLKEVARVAENELLKYWMDAESPGEHLVHNQLSRYCDHYVNHTGAEYESGWDLTSRFNNKGLHYLPVDLNSCLYKYETDLAEINNILSNKTKEKMYINQAQKRKDAMQELMWGKKNGFFFDYDYTKRKRSKFYSLAGFYPLWAKVASESQAREARDSLKRFEYEWGLANTQKEKLSDEFKQWDYPNGWPNQQWIVLKGLLNYGFVQDAERLAKKWLDLNKKIFLKTGRFWEKYDVVGGDIGKSGRYPTQAGFGWTNGVFIKLISELGS